MPRSNLLLTLGKVIIAAAWVDGEVSPEEVNSLKDLLFRLPDLTGREWAMLEMYIEAPVGVSERERLVSQLQEELASPADQALALAALEDVIEADGVVTPREREVVDQIKAAIRSVDVSIFGQLGKLIKGPVSRRSAATAGTPNREEYFEDFIKNKVYYVLKHRQDLEDVDIDLPDAELRKLSLAGGLMAWVANVDREVTEGEFERMARALRTGWELSEAAAAFVAAIAVSEVSAELDYYRLTREFYANTSADERREFIDVLFAVADADGFVSHEEIEEIRLIATSLKITHKQFIAAKLKIPRSRRSS